MDITTKIKRSKLLYYVYYYVMSGLVNLYKLFLKPDGKLMLFVCYGGRHYSDSTRVIYEAMLKDERFKDYIIYWAFKNPEKYPFIPNTVNVNSLKYFNIALRARVWVTNVIVERALNFKGINTTICTQLMEYYVSWMVKMLLILLISDFINIQVGLLFCIF